MGDLAVTADLEEVATQAITMRIKEEDMTLTKISIRDMANMIITVMAIAVDMVVPMDWKKVQKNQLVTMIWSLAQKTLKMAILISHRVTFLIDQQVMVQSQIMV